MKIYIIAFSLHYNRFDKVPYILEPWDQDVLLL